jgi:hypothetical protein
VARFSGFKGKGAPTAGVFLGINGRTFTYESTAARAEHVEAGVRYPIDFALTSDDVAYILNRGREDRPHGTRLSGIRLGEEGEEYISALIPLIRSADLSFEVPLADTKVFGSSL